MLLVTPTLFRLVFFKTRQGGSSARKKTPTRRAKKKRSTSPKTLTKDTQPNSTHSLLEATHAGTHDWTASRQPLSPFAFPQTSQQPLLFDRHRTR